MENRIVPTVIVKTQNELDKMLARLNGKVLRVMLDIMDGRFVTNTSLDFDFQLPSSFKYEVHLMVENPSAYVEKLAGRVDWAMIHIETLENPETDILYFKENGFKVSLAVNPGTPLEALLPYLDLLDGVLFLTVNPGKHGAEFRPEALEKIRRLRALGVTLPFEADGGVNPGTIQEIKNAGVDFFACGSYLMKFEDVAEGLQLLREALGD
ncbi:hypothetical protein CL673_08350 [Candidatus Bathyarchaeota archaeon]|jgi:ribulose-phosphate 3-epimerase|nr:hypothetical protein [Candidatus Bathyarchaeota archaeon]MDP6048843.1 ribulose-phosphate 3-epimerase [Candidatus Bathyarchaeota archaeon]MDP7442768.1 ribulose-phosphate 3-epimerase [Candidatus Bathyarchaeota archaeon]|tara:strand:+ start:1695 stop:2324 length:630 start_codon:yes stop_codon:yes gene_type:complete